MLDRITEIVDHLLRHKALLGRHQWLRDFLRAPYHRLINWHGRGCPVRVGGIVEGRLPPEFSGKRVETYETAEFAVLNKWCRNNRHGMVVDVGCSIGYYACAALFSSPSVEVIAIDADLNSLKAAQRMCSYGGLDRLKLIHALIADVSSVAVDCHLAVQTTSKALASPDVSGDLAATNYRNLDINKRLPVDVPTYRLDELVKLNGLNARPVFIKVDVEGAEWFVLEGARRILERDSPEILLSVHPAFLTNYGKSKSEVASLLAEVGYNFEVLGIDHEEHWLCKPGGNNKKTGVS